MYKKIIVSALAMHLACYAPPRCLTPFTKFVYAHSRTQHAPTRRAFSAEEVQQIQQILEHAKNPYNSPACKSCVLYKPNRPCCMFKTPTKKLCGLSQI